MSLVYQHILHLYCIQGHPCIHSNLKARNCTQNILTPIIKCALSKLFYGPDRCKKGQVKYKTKNYVCISLTLNVLLI